MKILRFLLIIIPITFLLSSCVDGTRNKNLLAKAGGQTGEIILVIDSIHRNSVLGKEIENTFRSLVEGLPRPEPEFTIRYIMPEDFQGILKNAQNIIIVAVLNNYSRNSERVKNYFTTSSIERIKNEPDLFLLSKQNEWAIGQEVLFLYGQTDEILANKIAENRDKLRLHFNNIEKKRLEVSLYKAKELKEVGNVLIENHQFSVRVPFGWRVEFEDKSRNFVWLRLPGVDVDRNIWVYYEDYTTSDIFKDATAFRDRITKKYIYENKERNDTSYVVVETLIPPVSREINFHGKFALKMNGLWKTKNHSMGGPFASYMFVDEELNRIYFIDGFVYSPGKSQREFMREIDTILWTFRTESELKPST